MNVLFKKRSENDFGQLAAPTIFHDSKTSRSYGMIAYNEYKYKFSWQSDTIDPVITQIENAIYSIGIDQHYCIVDFNINKIILNISLHYNFFHTELYKQFIYAISELEILKISKSKYEIVETYGLPEIFNEIKFIDDEMEVSCLDDIVIRFPL